MVRTFSLTSGQLLTTSALITIPIKETTTPTVEGPQAVAAMAEEEATMEAITTGKNEFLAFWGNPTKRAVNLPQAPSPSESTSPPYAPGRLLIPSTTPQSIPGLRAGDRLALLTSCFRPYFRKASRKGCHPCPGQAWYCLP